jgi:hypothetical protein
MDGWVAGGHVPMIRDPKGSHGLRRAIRSDDVETGAGDAAERQDIHQAMEGVVRGETRVVLPLAKPAAVRAEEYRSAVENPLRGEAVMNGILRADNVRL